MEEKDQYISLQEATKLCSYSQDYLSLRARQGKLKARKIGRNWVTTKDWLKDYISKVEGFKNGLDVKKQERITVVEKQKIRKPIAIDVKDIPPPLNLPVKDPIPIFKANIFFSPLRAGVATALLFLFVFSGVVFGKDGVMNAVKFAVDQSQNVAKEVVVATKSIQDLSLMDIKNVTYGLQNEVDKRIVKTFDVINVFTKEFSGGFEYAVKSPGAASNLLNDYIDWVGESALLLPSNISKKYFTVNDAIERSIKNDTSDVFQGYSDLKDGVNLTIKNTSGLLKSLSNRAGNFLTSLHRKLLVQQEPTQIEEPTEIVKEVEAERVTAIEPIREVVREVVRVDSQNPYGITIYDVATGEPRCVISENGQIQSLAGKCEDIDLQGPPLAEEPPADESSVDTTLPLLLL